MNTLTITAHNPKGLDYEHVASTPAAAKTLIRTIIRQGGENIAVNGRLIPAETVAFIRGI